MKRAPPRYDALQALRGVAQATAVTIVAEVGEVSKYPDSPITAAGSDDRCNTF